MNAMKWADTCVLLLPSGRSASFEYGWCSGQGKSCVVFMWEGCEPELMYADTEIVVNSFELQEFLRQEVRP